MQTTSSYNKRLSVQGFLAVLPVIIILLLIRAYPIGVAIAKSFTNWDGLFKNDFVGLKNYILQLSGNLFWKLLANNLILLLHIPIQILLGIIFSLLLYEEIKGWKFFRSVSYMPQVISAVIIGYLFRVLFAYDGPINTVLRAVGLDLLAVEWLGNRWSALLVIIITMVYQGLGWQALLFLGGMSSISPSVFEAAKIDGAGYWTRLFKIVLPLLSHVVEYTISISIIWVFTGLFNFIYTMTGGGPGYDTTTIDYLVYRMAFVDGNRLGSACAVSVLLLIIVLLINKVQEKIAEKANDWGE